MCLQTKAKEVLMGNWMEGFTIPTKRLYPFQWNWDSGFSSLGFGNFKLEYSIRELRSLFSGQWDNGMIPHIIFHSENEDSYFPNWPFWNANVNRGAPNSPKTSGITQPPVHGFIVEALMQKHKDDTNLKAFVKEFFPKMVRSHRFFYSSRDPKREGLAYIYHPWESGRDNSPLWDTSMDRIVVDKAQLPSYERKDTSHASAEERPTSDHYDRYVYLLELGKKYAYDSHAIFEESPFLIQDTLINSVLIKSNQSLIRIGKELGLDTGEIEEWQQQAIATFRDKLWCEDLKTFVSYDCRAGEQIAHKEVGGMATLFAGIPTDAQSKFLNEYILTLHQRGFYTCPSFDVDSPLFNSKRYWRGPIWPQMNWLVSKGLSEYGYNKAAAIVKNDLIELVSRLGFYEYFESQKPIADTLNKGYGGGNFTWTAACILDFLEDN